MSREKLNQESIDKNLKELSAGWVCDGKALKKEFQFPNFVKAFSFLTEVAIHSEGMDHHPKITNVYNRVEIELWTHDADGLTELDFRLAKKIG